MNDVVGPASTAVPAAPDDETRFKLWLRERYQIEDDPTTFRQRVANVRALRMRLAALADTTHQYDRGLWQGYQRAVDDIRTWLSNTKRLGMKS